MKRVSQIFLLCSVCGFPALSVGALETLLTSDPGNRDSPTLVWTVFADGSDSAVTGGNAVATTGSLSNAIGDFAFRWTAEYNFDQTTLVGTLSDLAGNKWGYNSNAANLGPQTPIDTSLRLEEGEAVVMTFDLGNLELEPGYVLRLDSVSVRNANGGGEDAGGRFSYFDQSRGTLVQLTGTENGQIAPVAGDPVSQTLNQIVDTGDEVAVWRESNFNGQVRLAGFQFSVVQEPPAPMATDDSLTMHWNDKVAYPVLRNDSSLGAFDRIEITAPPVHGRAEAIGDLVRFDHADGMPSSDSFSYRLVDLDGRVSNEATVSISFSSQLRIANSTLNVPADPPAESYRFENAFPGLTFFLPLSITSPPGETERLFVCEKTGTIQLALDVSDSPSKTAFLDLAELLELRPSEVFFADNEGGLLGLAFHPDYAENGYFFVFYSLEIDGQLHQRVSRFSVSQDPNAADPASELVLIEQFDEAGNHNGGDLQFGPDGYLYVSVGDEGGGNDVWNNSQRIDKDYFSGILRIDVDKAEGNLEPNPHPSVKTDDSGDAFYSVPADNPWVGATSFNGNAVAPSEVITEFYAVGLRNPWRIHFDPDSGELYAADVGQNAREEINLVAAGGNYGWAFFEASLDGPDAPAPEGFSHDAPIYEYARGAGPLEGRSVSGGVVYRGSVYQGLVGKYVFGDYTSGNVWALERDGETVSVERIAGAPGPVGFGYDPSNGDVLVASISEGQIQRLVAGDPVDGYPAALSETGVFADVTDLSPNPGVLHYEPNLAFWSDHAIKDRWFVVPDLVDTIAYAEEEPWTFPSGTVWVKHFEIETERGNPASRKRLETRLLVKNEEGAYGVSYRWNEEESEAYLVPSTGVNFPVEVDVDGNVVEQTWRIPSRSECMTCHLPNAGHALSFNTRQLNRESALGGAPDNQIATLRDAGYLSSGPDDVKALPRHVRSDETMFSLEARARSYLAVNCAYCHQSGGSNPADFDLSASLSLSETQLLSATLNNDGGDEANALVIPGDSSHSVLWHRIGGSGGFTRMPPLATNVLDQTGIDLIGDWIDSELPRTYQNYAQWRLEQFNSDSSSEGAPTFDADGDGASNEVEWLTRTDPNDAGDLWRPEARRAAAGDFELVYQWILDRVINIEESSDLKDWTPLDVPENHGLPSGLEAEAALELEAPDAKKFYRIRVEE